MCSIYCGLLFLQKRYNSIKEESLDIFGGVVLKYLWQGHTLIVNSILKVSQHIDLERELERFQDKRVDKCQLPRHVGDIKSGIQIEGVYQELCLFIRLHIFKKM